MNELDRNVLERNDTRFIIRFSKVKACNNTRILNEMISFINAAGPLHYDTI